jgi:hypothetical protein
MDNSFSILYAGSQIYIKEVFYRQPKRGIAQERGVSLVFHDCSPRRPEANASTLG